MSFYFPPKKPSEELVKAEEKLKTKGYAFSSDKKMCQFDPELGELIEDKGFAFEVKKGDQSYNQKNYEDIGDIITEYTFGLLESDPMNLKRVPIPKHLSESDSKSFVFVSEDFESNPNLCVIIHGSGVVRAGQWTRKLIMNNDLEAGTIMPDIMMAKKEGFAVLVTNTNDNKRLNSDGKMKVIPECSNAVDSAMTTWENYVSTSIHKKIIIIGHSYGGVVTMQLARKFKTDFEDRVISVLLTDSVHGNSSFPKTLAKQSINFVASDRPLDSDLGKDSSGLMVKSAGHKVHEWTPSSSRNCLFHYFGLYNNGKE